VKHEDFATKLPKGVEVVALPSGRPYLKKTPMP